LFPVIGFPVNLFPVEPRLHIFEHVIPFDRVMAAHFARPVFLNEDAHTLQSVLRVQNPLKAVSWSDYR
jgi:hypothetical protein